MGWFEDQIKQRKQKDEEAFAEAFFDIAGAVTGERIFAPTDDKSVETKKAIDAILKYHRIKPTEIPDTISDVNDQLEYLLRPCGVMYRTIKLSKGWYKDAAGAMLGVRKSDSKMVALIPNGFAGYFYTDETGKKVRIDRNNEGEFEEALAFYKPFPLRKIGISDLLRYMTGSVSGADAVITVLASLLIVLIGMLVPYINNIIFSQVITSGSIKILAAVTAFLVSVIISTQLMNSVKTLLMSRLSTKMSLTVEAATMMRVLSLPADFFMDYSAGELMQRVQYINSMCSMLTDTILSTGFTSVFSLVYIVQIRMFAPKLTVPAVALIQITFLFSVVSALVQMNISKRKLKISSDESGMTFALISGISKIKVTGSEKRAFARWGRLFAQEASLMYNPPVFIKINKVIGLAITLAGSVIMYYIAARSGISVADYCSFNSAYGMVSAAFISLSSVALLAAQIKPILDTVKPILEAEPEISSGKEVVTNINGEVKLSNVSFSYSDDMPPVIDNMSLHIKPGQYVAVVGRTGCGKSTLMRLLLGFEKPQKGAIYYDGKDMEKLDLRSLRKKIGIVMQNGKLFQGDIFSNIAISSPRLTLDEAWEAAELSGMADDIKSMPMGMFTMISEGGGGISGGQKQRLMIARAIAQKPKLLMFDEATSALDNITQKKVSESLDGLKCTRIVIAHRLSTIKQCDRIIVIDGGHIIEDGKYDELIAKNGFFAQLVERQRVDKG